MDWITCLKYFQIVKYSNIIVLIAVISAFLTIGPRLSIYVINQHAQDDNCLSVPLVPKVSYAIELLSGNLSTCFYNYQSITFFMLLLLFNIYNYTHIENQQLETKLYPYINYLTKNRMNNNNQKEDILYSLKCGLASFTATYVSGVMHPLDVIKTRFQSHDGKANSMNLVPKYQGIFKGLKQIYIAQGFKGLYKGFYISLLSNALATSLFFWLYEARKKVYENQGMSTLNSVTYASLQASIFATFFSQPFWVIRTRMLLNIKPNQKQFSHAFEKTMQIYRQDGLKGFAKGLTLSIMVSFTGFIQMYSYEGSKMIYYSLKLPSADISEQNFICGSFSKMVSILITYPITTVRTRIQQNQYVQGSKSAKYTSLRDISTKMMRDEGITGFYKGLWANMLKGIPQRGIYFYVYQYLKNLMIQDNRTEI